MRGLPRALMRSINELTQIARPGTLTVAGTTTTPATSVTVNGSNAILYADATFAATNMPLGVGTNSFTAVGQDGYWRVNSTSVTTWILCSLLQLHPLLEALEWRLGELRLTDTKTDTK